ncbi:MAG: hypothetical protein KDE05_02035 [Parvularculaceae bacterium]|nr:hypothetical protein [Parvularculaceae bacterium]
MSIETAEMIWMAVGGYLGLGALFAFYFVLRGVDGLDHAAKGAGAPFRLLLFPGAAALWPILLLRMLATPKGSAR